MSTNQLQGRRGEGTADGSGTRHCPRAPKSGGVGWMTFRVGAGTVGLHVVMSRVNVWGRATGRRKMNLAQDTGEGLCLIHVNTDQNPHSQFF